MEIIAEAVKHPHIKGILAQKPIAMNYAQARQIVDTCKKAGVKLAVNSNMRYDQSIQGAEDHPAARLPRRAILPTVDMRAIPHWQSLPGSTTA